MFHLLWSLIVGLIVGYVARLVMPGAQHIGILLTALLGIGGSYVGGLISQLFSKREPGASFHPAHFFMSVIGALVILYAYTKFGH